MANVIEFSIRAKDTFSKTFKKIGEAMSKVAKTIASFGKKALVAATAVVGFVAVMANGIDKTKKFADRIGVAVEELSKMQFVASQAGIGADQFNMATQRMTRRVAEAAQGMGEASGALNELGIDAKSFSKLGLEDKMSALAGSLGEVEDPADRLRLAFKLFDSEGTSMLQMLKNGSAAMRETARDAEFLGLVISKQAAANAESFTDSMGRATGSIKGTSRAIANTLMPILTGLGNRFANTMAENRGAMVEFVTKAIGNIITFGHVIMQVWDSIKKAFSSREGFSAFLDNWGSFIVTANKMLWSYAKMLPVVFWEGFKAAARIVGDFFTWVNDKLNSFVTGGAVADFSDTMAASIGDSFSKAASGISEGLKEPLEAFKQDAGEAGKAAAELFGINLDSARDSAKSTIAAISEFGTVVKDQLGSSGKQAKGFLAELDAVSAEYLSKQKTQSRQFAEEFFNVIMGTVDTIADGMADSIVEGKSMAQVFSNIGKQVAKELISMWIKVALKKVAASNIGIAATLKEGAISIATGMKEIAVNVFKAIASIPIVGPILAPIAVVAALASIARSTRSAGNQGKQIAGAAHGGLTNVPSESTYLLNKDERVLSPNQNKDLTEFLSKNGGGGSVTVDTMTIHILENVTDGASLENMDRSDLKEKYAVPLIEAFDELHRQGVSFEFVRRNI